MRGRRLRRGSLRRFRGRGYLVTQVRGSRCLSTIRQPKAKLTSSRSQTKDGDQSLLHLEDTTYTPCMIRNTNKGATSSILFKSHIIAAPGSNQPLSERKTERSSRSLKGTWLRGAARQVDLRHTGPLTSGSGSCSPRAYRSPFPLLSKEGRPVSEKRDLSNNGAYRLDFGQDEK